MKNRIVLTVSNPHFIKVALSVLAVGLFVLSNGASDVSASGCVGGDH